LTRAITIIAMTCLLVAGAAVTSILGRDSVPVAGAATEQAVVNGPVVANRDNKTDKLTVIRFALASLEPSQTTSDWSEPLRQAYAASSPADIEAAQAVTAPVMPIVPPLPGKPKAASKPVPQKTYALLSDEQIAGIKERLKLSAAQESYWPPVETALRAVARKIHTVRGADTNAAAPPIDPDSAEVQELKSAAMPLLFQLREDQKKEVRALARIIGLEKVAEQI
jgi:hypothetical protein